MNLATSSSKGGFLQYLFIIFTILLLSSISNASLLNEAKSTLLNEKASLNTMERRYGSCGSSEIWLYGTEGRTICTSAYVFAVVSALALYNMYWMYNVASVWVDSMTPKSFKNNEDESTVADRDLFEPDWEKLDVKPMIEDNIYTCEQSYHVPYT